MQKKMIENRMVIASEWSRIENTVSKEILKRLPVCDCCKETILQNKALHIISGYKKNWMCDRCIEDCKQDTGLEG